MTRFNVTLLLCCTYLSVTIAQVHAAGTLANSIGAKQAGRGGANLAFSDSGAIIHDNPAGLLGVFDGDHCCNSDVFVDGSLAGIFPNLRFSDPQNANISSDNNPFGLGYVSIGRRVNEQFALGVGAFVPAGFAARWTQSGPPAVFPGDQLYNSLGAVLRILPSVSYKVNPRLTVGGTLGVAVSHIELEGPYFVNSAPRTGTPVLLDTQSTGAALSWSLGLQYWLTDSTVVAARYQSQNRFRNGGNTRFTIPGLGTGLYNSTTDIVWPRAFGLGLKQYIGKNQRFGIDFDWEQWSRAFDRVDLQFDNPDSALFGAVVGQDFSESLPLNWRDAVSIKTGYEIDLNDRSTARLGYGYGRNPVTSEFATTYIPTTLVHTFSVGFGQRMGEWELDAAYQHAFGPTVQVQDSQLAGDDFSNSSINTQTHWLFLSALRRF